MGNITTSGDCDIVFNTGASDRLEIDAERLTVLGAAGQDGTGKIVRDTGVEDISFSTPTGGLATVKATGAGGVLTFNVDADTTLDASDVQTVSEAVNGASPTGSIVCPAKASIVDGDYLTIADGIHAATKFEPRAKATGTITCKALADINDGDTITIDDGTNAATVFEFDVGGDGAAGSNVAMDVSECTDAQSVAVVVVAAINGVVGTLTVTAGTPVAGVIPLLADTLDSAHNVAITETGTSCTVTGMSTGLGGAEAVSGAVVVDLTGISTAALIGPVLRTAIAGVGETLALTATANGATVSLINPVKSSAGNIAITEMTGTAFTLTGMTGGFEPIIGDAPTLDALTEAATVANGKVTALQVDQVVLPNTATPPSAPTDKVHLYSADVSAGNATLAIYAETAPAVDAEVDSTHSLTVFINGTKYRLLLATLPE